MAHKKGVGSTDNGRDSNSKRLGVKLFGGQHAIPGNIIIRQRGTKFHPGQGVGMGRDFTIYSLVEGEVKFTKKRKNRTYVNVISSEEFELMNKRKESATKKAEPKKKAAPKKKETPVVEAAPAVEAEVKEEAAAPVEEVVEPVVEEVVETKAAEEVSADDRDGQLQALMAKMGSVDASEKDDLKLIKGVGPKLEGMLNDIGIYNFQQISKLSVEDYDMIDNVLGSFKGRAKRDEWAKQAQELLGQADLLVNPFKAKPDNLKIIEGIGPKIEALLKKDGINTWEDLSKSSVERLSEILDAAGDAYRIHKPTTWPQQAQLATDGKWDELVKLQDELIGGR